MYRAKLNLELITMELSPLLTVEEMGNGMYTIMQIYMKASRYQFLNATKDRNIFL